MKKFFVMTVCCLVAAMCAFSLVACLDKPHEHSGGTANCTDKAVCEVCGEEYGETNLSVHKSDEFTYSVNASDPSKHDKKHKCCGALVETVAHSGGTATLDSKAKCEFCDAEYGEKLQPSLTVDKTTATVTLGDTLTLTATPVGISGALEWSSDNESVATVSDGVVTAIKEGTANITVSGGGKSATCAVTVGLGGFVPALNFINPVSDTVELTMLETVDLGANVSFNGKTYSDAQIYYNISPAGVVKVEGGVLKPVAAGDATVTVTATWRNVTAATLSKTLTVNVSNAVELKVNGNAVPDKITLYTIDELNGTNYDTSCDFSVTLSVNGESKTATVAPADTTKVTYSSNTLTAGAYGNTTVGITYSDTTLGITVDETVDIEVIRPVATYANKIEWFSAYDGELLNASGENVLTELFAGGVESATQAGEDGDITLDTETTGKILGVETSSTEKTVTTVTVNAATYAWKFNVEGYTFVIDEPSDLLRIELTENRKLIKGYFILKNDINALEAYPSNVRRHHGTQATGALTNNATGGFQGTFDGNGHKIDKLFIGNSYGFFGCAFNFTVKNIAFTNADASGNYKANLFGHWFGLAASPVNIENVYAQIVNTASRTESLGIFASQRNGGVKADGFLLEIKTPTNPCTIEYNANIHTGGVGLFKSDPYSITYANNPSSWAYLGGEMKNMYIVSNQVYQRIFPLVQYKGVSVYAANDYAAIENGTKITFSDQFIPSADETGTDTLYRYKNAYRYNTFADLMDESKGNVQKVGNWKITSDGPVWEA